MKSVCSRTPWRASATTSSPRVRPAHAFHVVVVCGSVCVCMRERECTRHAPLRGACACGARGCAVLDRSLVDMWVKSDDYESFITSRRLIREEGILCGGSSGSAVSAALKAAKTLKKGQRCVVLLPDSVRNYMTKFLNDDWMWRMGFVDKERNIGVGDKSHETTWWATRTVGDLTPTAPVTVTPAVTCGEAVDILKANGYDQLPVVSEDNSILGMVTEGNLTSRLTSGRVSASDSITKALYSQFRTVTASTPLFELARMFDRDHFVVVVQTQRTYSGSKESAEKSVVTGIVTRIDMLKYITKDAPVASPKA
ncbi:pyridoxal-phosphate dependent enzyme [archaeon]|nr:MAG: pyridoxal-phosphate dependent enzyme [archaeon]